MFDYTTLVAFAAVVFAFHLTVAWLARRRADPAADERADRLKDGRLQCPRCEAVNEPAYQFCRRCVRKLQVEAPTVPIEPASGRSPFR